MSDDPPSSPINTHATTVEETKSSAEYESIISELRTSLSGAQSTIAQQTTKLSTMADLNTELAQLKDQFSFIKAAKEAVESQLQSEKIKLETAEELMEDQKRQIEALRGQVEQARRGVGILQKQEKERKRMSVIGGVTPVSNPSTAGGGLGLTGAGIEGLVLDQSIDGDKSSKRQSIMVGKPSNAHKRTSSVSDGSDHPVASSTTPTTSNVNPVSTSPVPGPAGNARPGLRELRLGVTSSSSSTTPPPLHSPSIAEADEIRGAPGSYRTVSSSTLGSSPTKRDTSLRDAATREKDLREAAELAAKEAEEESSRLSKDLIALKRKLEESEEARLASDACLKALREFIGGGGGGGGDGQDPLEDKQAVSEMLKGISLPPLPTDKDADEDGGAGVTAKPLPARPGPSPRKTSTWGSFGNLFSKQSQQQPASPATSTIVEPPATPQAPPLLSPPQTSKARSNSIHRTISPLPAPQELDEHAVEGIPDNSTTPITWVSSWTKSLPTPTTETPGGGGAGRGGIKFTPGGNSIPPPPTSSRKLSSFFGFSNEPKLPLSHEFDAHDAFTPEQASQDHLEPSLLPLSGPGSPDPEENGRTPGTSHTALTDDIETPLSPMSQPAPVMVSGGKQDGEENVVHL